MLVGPQQVEAASFDGLIGKLLSRCRWSTDVQKTWIRVHHSLPHDVESQKNIAQSRVSHPLDSSRGLCHLHRICVGGEGGPFDHFWVWPSLFHWHTDVWAAQHPLGHCCHHISRPLLSTVPVCLRARSRGENENNKPRNAKGRTRLSRMDRVTPCMIVSVA